ncbi:MAG TPA: hypothetical protein VGR35_12740 [Tepidisphaeraceae bacterium]|nr:hypothetical protein [Tepidisphaeraceae bacterium]
MRLEILAFILLCLLAVWWVILTLWVISCHRERGQDAARPLTPEEQEELRELEAGIPRRRMRAKDYLFVATFLLPVVLVMLPLYLYGWLVKDPPAGEADA